MKIFLDANVFIGSRDENHSHFASCNAFFNLANQQRVEFCTSCDLITTIYYIIARKYKKQALKEIDKINRICEIIEFGNLEVKKAIHLMQSDADYDDLEDTIQYVLAQKSKCDLIVSNDKNFIAKDMKLRTAAEFVSEYSD